MSIKKLYAEGLFPGKILLLGLLLISAPFYSFSQAIRPLSYYLETAARNNPALKENSNRQSLNAIQKNIISAQVSTPQVSLTGDYLLSPFFNSNGKAVEITNNPSAKAFGYDVGITNGGLYSALLNINVPLFTRKISAPLFLQNKIQQDQLTNEQLAIAHELGNKVTTQFIETFQLQQQIQSARELLNLLTDRIVIAKKLMEKGLLPAGDYLLLQIEYGNTANDTLDLEMKFNAGIGLLNNLCGISDTTIVQLEMPVLEISPLKTSFNYLEKYRIDSLGNAALEKVFNVKYQPQLNLFGNTGLNASYAPDMARNLGLSAGVHLAVPIYDGHQKKLIGSLSRINQQILDDNKTNIALQLKNSLRLLENAIGKKQNIITRQQEQLKQYQTLLRVYREQAVNGQLSVIVFTTALSQYKTVQQKISQEQTDLLLLISNYNYLNW
ncbi:MAG: TolC family protein [Bacteroidetes bacterium]|nr:TolC family protein [Bacteroidota bacterium]